MYAPIILVIDWIFPGNASIVDLKLWSVSIAPRNEHRFYFDSLILSSIRIYIPGKIGGGSEVEWYKWDEVIRKYRSEIICVGGNHNLWVAGDVSWK